MSCSILREEIGHNLFFTGDIALFFKNLCFQQPLGSWRNGLITSTLIVKLPCGTPISCSLTFVLFYNTRRNRRKSFLHWNVCLFLQKFMFSATSWVMKKWSYNFNINCQVTLWTLIGCCRKFVMYYNTRRSRPKFFHWKLCLFLQKFMFSATSWVMKKWSYNFNINCQVTLRTLISCSLTFVMFYNTRRIRP